MFNKLWLKLSVAVVVACGCLRVAMAGDAGTVGGEPTNQLPDMPLASGATMLPNGWKLSPAGSAVQLAGDMPTQAMISPDGKYVLISTGGYNEHGISVVEIASGKMVDHVKVAATFAGMCWDASGKRVYLSPGGVIDAPTVHTFTFEQGRLTATAGVNVKAIERNTRFIGGLASGSDGALYIVNVAQNKVYKTNGNGENAVSATVGYRPCAISLSPDGAMLAVANWGDQSVSLLDASDLKVKGKIQVGNHPAALVWNHDGRLFVANAGGNTVSVVDAGKQQVIETIRTSLDFQIPVGSTPVALAIDAVSKRLYIANADNNDVAVVDISDDDESRVMGFIPTGWYPCALATSADGKNLFVATGKALDKFVPNNKPPILERTEKERAKTYIGNLLTGHLSIVQTPDEKALSTYTRQVLANTPVPRDAAQLAKSQSEILAGSFRKIKHVVYVIKENRTYDQVFGDMPQGNGDPSVCMFGRKITPNHHALAGDWVLLDNLYCNGEVSFDGHAWCDAAYANDFNQRSWTNTYSKRKIVDADDRLERQPGGYIWDNAVAHHLSFMSYGEGAAFISNPQIAPDVDEKSMAGLAFSKPWQAAGWNLGKGQADYQRMQIFIDDLHAAEKTGDWPALTVMSLPQDHTAARRVGISTPDACVAANDLALGMLVEAVSHSKFWAETAIFVIEDDAQNGQDHVDAHRTVGLVISPYVRRGAVDHTMYTTASLVRTIELILGLPPMTQYDAAATPMFNSFMAEPDLKPYTHLKAEVDLKAVNPPKNPGAQASAQLDFSDIDRADPDQFNAILWDWFKPGTASPAPVRSMVFVQ